MVNYSGEIIQVSGKTSDVPIAVPSNSDSDSNSKKSLRRRSAAGGGGVSVDGTLKSTEIVSTIDGRSKGSHLSNSNKEAVEHDRKSALAVQRLKMAILLFFTLTAVGVTAAFIVYRHYNKEALKQEFTDQFREDAENMLASLGTSIDSMLGATDAFAISMLAFAKATNQTYPFVTIGDFAVQAGKLLKNSRAKIVNTYAVVEEDQRKEWEAYAPLHTDWIQESYDVQNRNQKYTGPHIDQDYIDENYFGHYDLIHGYDEVGFGGNNTNGVQHEGVHLPFWQCTPLIPIYPLYNWDLTTAVFKPPYQAVLDTHLVTITEPYMIAETWDHDKIAENEDEAAWLVDFLEPGEEPMEPISDIYYPVIVEALNNVNHRAEDYKNTTDEYSVDPKVNKLGAILSQSIYWRDTLHDLLPRGSSGVVVVFENECAVTFSYEIAGPVPRYLGTGQFNSTFEDDDLMYEMRLKEIWKYGIKETAYTGIPINEDVCPFTLKVYPAEGSREAFYDNDEDTMFIVLVLVLSIAILTIAFTLLFFFIYDRLVRNEIRNKINLLDAKRNFVRFVSHEVRTPLNTVSMGLTLIHQDISRRERGLKNLDAGGVPALESAVTAEDLSRWSTLTKDVTHNADVAVGVLNDLLNIDKIQMGAFKLEKEVLSIWNLIEETTMEFKMMAAKQKTELKFDISSLAESHDVEVSVTSTSMLPSSITDQKLVGDPQRIQQVIRNLLSNAIKFSKNRSVALKVSTRENTSMSKDIQSNTKEFKLADGSSVCLAVSGRVVVDVIDTGVGMTPIQLETVFDVGTQFNANKLQAGGGSGLGLAFAKAISEQHGGSLRAYSDGRDKGTTFRLDLPLYVGESMTNNSSSSSKDNALAAEEGAPSNAKAKAIIEEETLEPMQILVVDDAIMNRKLLIRLLESNGHTCGQAENGQALIDAIDDCLNHTHKSGQTMMQYDCILVDYEMPVMNGPEACKAIREMGYTGFVVGVTGNLLPEDVGYFMDCGADAVLPKPFKYKDLEQLLIEQGMFSLTE